MVRKVIGVWGCRKCAAAAGGTACRALIYRRNRGLVGASFGQDRTWISLLMPSVGLVSTSVVGSADESDAPDKRGERDHSDSFHVGLIRSEASSLILIRLATPRSERRGAPGTCM